MKHDTCLMMGCLCTAFAVTPSMYAKDGAGAAATPAATSAATSSTTPATVPAATAASGSNASTSTDAVAATDKDLMRKLAFANASEIATANLALKKSSNGTVKAFAQHMIDDHTQAGEELKTLAQRKNVALPTGRDAQHVAASKKMALMSGATFDKIYLHEAGLVDHRATLQLLEHIGMQAKVSDLKAPAQKLVPTVVAHLDMVQKESAESGSHASSHDHAKADVAKTPAAK